MRSGTYDFLAQERIIWGKPAAEAAVAEADRLGAKRVFLVASRTLNVDMAAELDGRMKNAVQRLNKLQGPGGRQAVMSDRKQKLIGTDIERRLVAGLEEAALSPIIAPGQSVSSYTDAQLNQISPLRNSIDKRLAEQRERATRYSKRNVELGNEYTDDSVLWFVST